MNDVREDLDRLIAEFLSGRTPFADFQASYSRTYADESADEGFTSAEIDYYGAVHERAEWTAASPTAEDRSDGWIDFEEFRSWLSAHVHGRAVT